MFSWKFATKAFVFVMLLFSFFSLAQVDVVKTYAADIYAPENCKQKEIKFTNIFVISANYPIIKKECSIDDSGNPRPLSPSLLGDVMLRAYAFLLSLAFTIALPSFVAIGFFWIYSGIDESQAAFAKKWLQKFGVGLVLLMFAWVVPITIAAVFKFPLEQTNLDNFFSF